MTEYFRKFLNYKSLVFCNSILLFTTITASASPVDPAYKKARVKAHTLSISSKENFSQIPRFAKLQYAFQLIQGQTQSLGFSKSDEEIINLSYARKPPIDRAAATLLNACSSFKDQKRNNSIDGYGLAQKLRLAQQQEEQDIEKYYQLVVNKLSPDAKDRVENIINQANGTDNLHYSSFNQEDYSMEFPDFAPNRLSEVCHDLPLYRRFSR